ncbi:MAG: type 1 glutamine amidotransferase [Proteobacteria bacterium]|jgi:GMP synthase-like glutamine amidotransferase|nr:type 1 glutamine amidotransferase [Pseudomonadota bacterium]
MNARVLIVDCCVYPDIYRPVDHWRALLGGAPADSVYLPSGGAAPDLAAYTHVVLTGSEASIVAPEPWYEVEIELVRRAAAAGKAILGSCFGHQMLALALSGPRHVRASATPELGWAAIDVVAADSLLAGLPDPFHAFVAHFDEVVDPPPPWRVLARSAGCAVQVMRHGDEPIWGVQAHPEIDPATGRALLEGLAAAAPGKAGIIGRALTGTPRDDGVAGEIVRRFLSLPDPCAR